VLVHRLHIAENQNLAELDYR